MNIVTIITPENKTQKTVIEMLLAGMQVDYAKDDEDIIISTDHLPTMIRILQQIDANV